MYTITFKQSAGITNPITATGRATVVIKDADAVDHTDDRVVIQSKVTLSKGAGARGTAVTVSAVGLLGGGATAFLVQGDCPDQGKDPVLVAAEADNTDCTEEDDISLGTATASGGKVSVDIDTSSSDFVVGNDPYDKLGNPIWVNNVIGGTLTLGYVPLWLTGRHDGTLCALGLATRPQPDHHGRRFWQDRQRARPLHHHADDYAGG